MKPQIIYDMSEKVYHSQSHSEIPLLTRSTASELIRSNPYKVWYEHPKLGGNPIIKTKALTDGQIIHDKLLNTGKQILELPYKDFRTDEAKAARAEAEEQGMYAICKGSSDWQTLEEMATMIRPQIEQDFPSYYQVPHKSEVTIIYELNGVPCQSRLDFLSEEARLIVDIKSTRDANPYKTEKSMDDYDYDMQAYVYLEAANQIDPDKEWRFIFLFVEKKPPHLISIREPDLWALETGYQKWETASAQWKACLDAGTEMEHWPGYGYGEISVPQYTINKWASN